MLIIKAGIENSFFFFILVFKILIKIVYLKLYIISFFVHFNFPIFFKPKEFTILFEDIPEILETSFDVCFFFNYSNKDEKSLQ